MIHLASKSISQKSLKRLKAVQNGVDAKSTFDERAKQAEKSWKGKKRSIAGKACFEEVEEKLVEMCVGVEICNYCEQNEASDVEHIYPKSLFPGKAFQWDNYLLACKTCNTKYKLDQFAIFKPSRSSKRYDLERGEEPSNSDACFINPRKDDPMKFFWLDLTTGTFQNLALVKGSVGSRGAHKAEATLDILALNGRQALVRARKSAYGYYFSYLERCKRIHQAKSKSEFENAVDIITAYNLSDSLADLKQLALQSVKHSILSHQHPTVWKEMKRQKDKLPKLKQLFDAFPQALNW